MMVTITTYSQKRKDQEGKIQNLKGITEFNLVFDYENIAVHKWDNEKYFLKDKMDKRKKRKLVLEKNSKNIGLMIEKVGMNQNLLNHSINVLKKVL